MYIYICIYIYVQFNEIGNFLFLFKVFNIYVCLNSIVLYSVYRSSIFDLNEI